MPRPRKIDYPTYWSWRQAHKAWLPSHGGSLWTTALLVLVVSACACAAAASAWPFLVIAAVAIVGTIYARSRP